MGIELEEGHVVIVSTSQAGTIVQLCGTDAWVLLQNNDLWVGPQKQCQFPQSREHLDACPVDVERFEERERRKFVEKD